MHKKGIFRNLIVMLVPTVIIAVGLVITVSSINARQIIYQQINREMNSQLDTNSEYVQKLFLKHAGVAETLAQTVASSHAALKKEQYVEMLKRFPATNAETCGVGVWSQPYTLNKKARLFGPYAYKKDGKVIYTDDYSNPKYNYPAQAWYKIGMDKTKSVAWSEAYVDPVTNVSMITATSPIVDQNEQLLGVTTADMDLTSLQKKVDTMKIGKTGRVMLVDSGGTYLATDNAKKVMKQKIQKESNQSLRVAAQKMMKAQRGETTYNLNGRTYKFYYSSIPNTPLRIGISIDESELYAPVNALLMRSVFIGLIFILLVVLILYFTARHLTRPLTTAVAELDRISEGDLTADLSEDFLKRSDEAGLVMRAVKKTQNSLRKLLLETRNASQQVSDSNSSLNDIASQVGTHAEGVSSAVQEIAKGTTEEADTLTSVVERVNRFHASVLKMAEDAKVIDQTTRDASERAEAGTVHVGGLSASMEQFQSTFSRLEDKTGQLGQLIKKIGGFTDLINDIADQTHLLSLNASIEAARAGDNGKGFAVVAEEIGKLAGQSGRSAKDIQILIADLSKEMALLTRTSHEMKGELGTQSKKVNDAIQSYQTIAEKMKSIAPKIEIISQSSVQLDQESREIFDKIQEISAVAEQTSASTEEISASAEDMNESMRQVAEAATAMHTLTEKLTKQLAGFRL